MSIQDDQTPATKADIGLLMDMLGKFYDDQARWKQENDEWKKTLETGLDTRFSSFRETMIQDFLVLWENLSYDLMGDRDGIVKDHGRRIIRLERKTGLRAL